MKMNGEQKITVSLTSFPEAIPYAVQAIRSVLGGSLLPDRVVLYLDINRISGVVAVNVNKGGLRELKRTVEQQTEDADDSC